MHGAITWVPPPHTPAEQVSPKVQTSRSSHAAPSPDGTSVFFLAEDHGRRAHHARHRAGVRRAREHEPGQQQQHHAGKHQQCDDAIAHAIGVPEGRIIARHLLPNCLPPLIVVATVQVAHAIALEATLSFLGVGVPVTEPSLGTLIRIGNDFLFSGEWWIAIFPGVALAVLVLAVNLLGDWLRDALNPKLR